MSKLSALVCDCMERGMGTPIGTPLDVCVSMLCALRYMFIIGRICAFRCVCFISLGEGKGFDSKWENDKVLLEGLLLSLHTSLSIWTLFPERFLPICRATN